MAAARLLFNPKSKIQIPKSSDYFHVPALLLLLLVLAARAAAQSSLDTPARDFDFEHMRLELTFTRADIAEKQMRGVVTYRVNNRPWAVQDGAAAPLTLPLNAVGLKIQSVEVAGPYELSSTSLAAQPATWRETALWNVLEGVAWRKAAYEAKNGLLTVDLGEQPRKFARDWLVRVRYLAKNAREGLYFVLPDADHPGRPPMVYSMSEPLVGRRWLPCHDWPDTRWTSDIFITVPKPLSAVTIGQPVEEPFAAVVPPELADVVKPDEELWTHHWRQSDPVDPHMLGFAVSEFVALRDWTWRGRPVPAYVQPGDEDAARYTFRRVPEMLEFYSKTIGVEYPFPQFSHVGVIDHFHGGMEHIGFDMLAPSMFTTGDRGDVLEHISQYNYIAHMIGHHWFGGLVNYKRVNQAWLNEGFATYLHQMWRSQTHSWDSFQDEMWRTAQGVTAVNRVGRGKPLVRDDLEDAEEVYRYDGGSVYWKGAWVLHMLSCQMGKDKFWGAVRAYLEKHRWSAVETEDFRKVMEEAAGKDLKPFFDQWVYRGGVPELDVKYRWDADRKRAVVEVRQTQTINEKHPAFAFPLRLFFNEKTGGTDTLFAVTQAEQVFEAPLDRSPTVFCADPDGELLKTLKEDKPAVMWVAQVRNGPTALARSAAIEHLQAKKEAAAFDALREALLDAKEFAGTRQRAARALKALRTDENADAILSALLKAEQTAGASPALLATLVELLGGFRESREAYAAVLGRADNEEHISVQAAALNALDNFKAELRTDDFISTIAKAAVPGVSRHVRDAALEILKKLDDPRALDTLLPAMKVDPRTSIGMAAETCELLMKLAEKDSTRQPGVRDALVRQLADPRPTVRTAALRGLETAGDGSVLPALRDLAEKDETPKVRKAADAAIKAIEKRKS